MTHAVAKGMAARKGGRIVNIASDAGRVGSTGEVVYSGCKGATIAFAKALAREVARSNVTVNTVCPGPTDTPAMDAFVGTGEAGPEDPRRDGARRAAGPHRRARRLPRPRRLPRQRRRGLHDRPDDQRLGRTFDARMKESDDEQAATRTSSTKSRDGVVRITINRPEVYNAFRNQTLEELIDALRRADEEKSANVMVLSGAGDKAFCTGGDQKVHLSEDGLYGPRGTVGMPIEEMQTALRDLRKVVDRQGAGLRDRRRQRLRDAVRPDDRQREGHLRPGRPEGRLGRPGLGHRLPRAHRRREEGARDLVPVPPLQRRRGREDGPRQQGRAARPARRRGRRSGARRSTR